MAANVYPIVSATEIQFFARNYTYASALTDLDILSFIIFTDLQVFGFTDHSGTVKKVLCDASGSVATPAERVFFADANGEADSDSNLTWDGTDLFVQGEEVWHGDLGDTITLTNGGHTATISLDASGVLSIEIDGIEQVNWSNGGPE